MKKILSFGAVILALLALIVYNTSVSAYTFMDTGYVIPKNELASVLSEQDIKETKDFNVIKAKENDEYTEKHGNYYDQNDKEIDLDFPMIIKNNTALRFFNTGSYVINGEFNYVALPDNSIISDESCFDSNGRVIDKDQYMMIQLSNSLYMSTTDFKIVTKLKEYTFKKFSLFYFDENYVNVYRYDDGRYSLVPVRGLTGAQVEYNNKTMSYEEFYKKLMNVKDIIKKEEKVVEEKQDEVKEKAKVENKTIATGTADTAVDADNPEAPAEAEAAPSTDTTPDVGPTPVTPPSNEYVKPTVSISDVRSWVWTLNGQLDIKDPSGRIQNGVVFYVYDSTGKLVLRQNVKGSGLFDVGVLEPDTDYVVYAKFDYRDKQNQLKSEDVLALSSFHTAKIEDAVQPVSFTYEANTYSAPESMIIKNILLKNTSDYNPNLKTYDNFIKNTLPYISKIQFTFTDDDGKEFTCNLSNSVLSALKKGNNVDSYETTKILDSLTKYSYTLDCYDKFGNVIPMTPAISGTYKTCKASPNVKFKLKSSSTTNVVLSVELDDKNYALLGDDYHIAISNGNEYVRAKYSYSSTTKTARQIDVPNTSKSFDLTIEDLPYASKLTVYAIGDYDLANGLNEQKDQIIGTLDFYSGSLPDGKIKYSNTFSNIGGTYAQMNMSISRSSTTELVSLLTDVSYEFKSDSLTMNGKLTQDQLNSIDIEKNYDEENKCLVIQEGDAITHKPRIVLNASKETLLSQGAWQTFLNSGLLGESNSLSGTLQFNFLRYTLTERTTYNFAMTSNIYINAQDHDITSEVEDEEFTTLAKDPRIQFSDFFLAENFIEIYDITSEDEGDTIVNSTYVLQLLEDGEMVNSKKLKVGESCDVVRFDNLTPGHQYTLQFVAPQFNQGSDESTLEKNHVLDSYEFDSVEGVKASISLDDIRNSYTSNTTKNTYIDVSKITKGTTYNTTTRQEEADPNSFITDYIDFKNSDNYYYFFQDFGGFEKQFKILGFNEKDQLVTWTTPSRANAYNFDQYCSNWFRVNTSVTKIRIVGYTGYENKARVYKYSPNASDLEVLADVSTKPDQFVDGIMPGTDTLDYTDLTKSTTGEIEVTPGETLYMQSNRTRYLYFYDKDHKYITNRGGGSGDYGIVEVPSQAKYVRMRIDNLDKASGSDVAKLYRIKDSSNNGYQAKMKVDLTDNADDYFVLSKATNDNRYYIRKSYSNDIEEPKYQQSYNHQFDLNAKSDGSVDTHTTFDESLDANKAFKYEIYVRYHGREIVLDTFTFKTDKKVYLLREPEDLKYIQYDSYATFIAMNDIIEDENYTAVNGHFGGVIDFQGHKLTLNYSSGNWLIYYLTPKGVIQNINVEVNSSIDRGLVAYNYGTIKNIVYDVNIPEGETLKQSLLHTNRETASISNFVIRLHGNTLVYNNKQSRYNVVFARYNYGEIKNGYVMNTEKDAKVYIPTPQNANYAYSGIVTGYNDPKATISKVYSTVDMATDYNAVQTNHSSAGIFAGYNGGRITNSFAVSDRYYFTYNLDVDKQIVDKIDRGLNSFEDPLIGYQSGTVESADGNDTGVSYRYANLYLLSDSNANYDHQYTYSKSFDVTNLYDPSWYDLTIQKDKQFDADGFASQGYYPMVLNSDDGTILANQSYNPLPEVKTVSEPTLLESVVEKETTSYVDVSLKFSNESLATINGITVENIGNAQILEQYLQDDIYYVKVRLSNPTEYVTGYKLKSFTYRGTLSNVTVEKDLNIDASFYKVIRTLADWKTSFVDSSTRKMNANYRLGNELDFGNVDAETFFNNYRVSQTFYGKLDGGHYDANGDLETNFRIRNIKIGNSNKGVHGLLFQNVQKGSIKNLDISDVDWQYTGSADYRVGLIYYTNYEVFDNINIQRATFKGTVYTGTLAAYSSNTTMTNITANDIKLSTSKHTNSTLLGGLVGYGSNMEIRNCYTAGLDIQTDEVDLTYTIGIGGIIGNVGGSRIEDCYSVGQIKSTSYCGGIAGSGNAIINRCYSDVYIETDGDYNGGIFGTSDTSASVNNSLSVGSFINSIETPAYTNPIISSISYWWLNNNFGYQYQSYNNQYYTDSADTRGIATVEQLSSPSFYRDELKLGSAFAYEADTKQNYKGVSEQKLPYLYSTDGKTLLPNQTDDYLTTSDLSVEVEAEAQHTGTETVYTALFTIKHSGYTVKDITIDGMAIDEKTATSQSDTIDKYTVVSKKAMAYDVYKARVVVESNTTHQEKVLTCAVNYNANDYWVISTAAQWQDVMRYHTNTNENILITGMLDFTSYDPNDIITDVSVNSIKGENEDCGFKNITISGKSSNCFINTVFTEASNLKFDNVKIVVPNNQSLKSVNGIIGVNQGNSNHLTFKNCSITGENNGYAKLYSTVYTGMICKNGGDVSDITAEGITIKAKAENSASNSTPTLREAYIGGVVSYPTSSVHNITAKNMNIDGQYCSSVGGIIGYAQKKSTGTVYISNLKLNADSNNRNSIYGSRYVGGVAGRISGLSLYDSVAENANVGVPSGRESDYYKDDTNYEDGAYIGGLVGYTDNLISNQRDANGEPNCSYNVKNVTVRGDHTVGGAIGRACNVSYLRVKDDTEVYGNNRVGGLSGISDGTLTSDQVLKTKVVATNADAGGLTGYVYTIDSCTALNVEVSADKYAGGIVGIAGSYNVNTEQVTARQAYVRNCGVVNSRVHATQSVGGIAGISYSTNSVDNYRNFVKQGTQVTGDTMVGGLIGEMKSGIWRLDYVDNTTVAADHDYAGGLVGKIDIDTDNDYSGSLYQSYSHATVSGRNYVGGLFGYYNVTVNKTKGNYYLYSLFNMSNVDGNDDTYAIGYFEDGALSKIDADYFKNVLSYEGEEGAYVTVKENKVTNGNLSNQSSDNISLIDKRQFTDYTSLNDQNGLNMSPSNFNNFITTAGKLENFAISYLGSTSGSGTNGAYHFKLSGIDLNDGTYTLKANLLNNTTNLTIRNIQDNKIYVRDGVAYTSTDNDDSTIDVSYGNNNSEQTFTFTISNQTDATQDYCKATVYNVYPSYATHTLTVNGETGSTYVKNTSNTSPITMTIDNADGYTWYWYRVYNNNGYRRNTVDVTSLANGNSLTTNVGGVYYAQSTSGNQRTVLFTYEGPVYYPLVSNGNLSNIAYQNGYTEFSSSYSKSMNYVNATKLGMITKEEALSVPEDEKITIPNYDIYASSVDSFNLEFDDSIAMNIDASSAQYQVELKFGNGDTISYPVTSRVMSFNYDFNTKVSVTIRSTINTTKFETKDYNVSDIAQTLSLSGDKYYYITNDGISGKDNYSAEGTFTNIYNDKAIKISNSKSVVYDLSSSTENSSVTIVNGLKLDHAQPLYSGQVYTTESAIAYDYFRNFMLDSDGNISTQIERTFIINGNKENVSIAGNTVRIGSGFILDVFDKNSGQENTGSDEGTDGSTESGGESGDTGSSGDSGTEEPGEGNNPTDPDTGGSGSSTADLEKVAMYLDKDDKSVSYPGSLNLNALFNNNQIKEIASNYYANGTHYLLVRHEDDSVEVIDYSTNSPVEKSSDYDEGTLVSLYSYARSYFANFASFLSFEPVSYTTKMTVNELEEELYKIPDSDMLKVYELTDDKVVKDEDVTSQPSDDVEEDTEVVDDQSSVDNSSTDSQEPSSKVTAAVVDRDYVPVYNPETRSFDIYTQKDVLSDKPLDKVKSENEKVVEAYEKGYKFSTNNGIIKVKNEITKSQYTFVIIVAVILVGVISLWLILKNKVEIFKK